MRPGILLWLHFHAFWRNYESNFLAEDEDVEFVLFFRITPLHVMQFCIYLSEHSLLDVAKIGSHFVHVVPPRFACDFFAAIGFR